MSIQFTGSNALFSRLGVIAEMLADINAFQTSASTQVNNIIAQYSGSESLIDGIQASLVGTQQGASSLMSFLQQTARNTANLMVFQDNPLSSRTNLTLSLDEIVRQMNLTSNTVQACVVGSTVSAALGNQGDGVIVCTTYRADGLVQENLYQETIHASITADSMTGTQAGNEQIQILGEVSQPNLLSNEFPLGSGGSATISAINGGQDNSQGNLLTNSDFENWTGSVPDNWEITVGAAQVLESTAQHYTGSASCEFVGDGSTLTAIEQTFNDSNGTLGTVSSLTAYACNCWIRMSASPAAGVLEFALVDDSDAYITDQSGTTCRFTQDLTGISTTWVPVSGVFRLPYVLPDVIKLRVRLSTASSNSKNLFLDRVGFGKMTQLYAGGPSFAAFSGAENFYAPDAWTVAMTNNRAGASNLKAWQTVFARLFNTPSLGILLPSTSGTPTISGSLIS